MVVFIIYIILINVATMALYAYDKQCARSGTWRISEPTLLTFAAVGGSLGAFLGMYVLRHKTRHLKFQICVPVFMIIHLITILIIINK